jgi:cytochrome P450
MLQGRLAFDMAAIHERYGPVVRIAPNELAFAHASAWRDIMAGKNEMPKWDEYYKVQHQQATNLMFAPNEEHAVMRRGISVGFSDRVLREMEPIIQSSVGLLMRRLRDQCNLPGGDSEVDMSAWYNFATFDLIGELAMGESYRCLENADYHPWVKPIFQVTHMSAIMSSMGHYPWFKSMLLRVFRSIISKKILEHQAYTRAKLTKRMETKRTDLVHGMLNINSKDVSSHNPVTFHPLRLILRNCLTLRNGANKTDKGITSIGQGNGRAHHECLRSHCGWLRNYCHSALGCYVSTSDQSRQAG